MEPRRPDERLPVAPGTHRHRRVVPGIVAEVEIDPGVRRDEDELPALGPVPERHRRDRDGRSQEEPDGAPARRERQDRQEDEGRGVHDGGQAAQEPRGEPAAPAALRGRSHRAVEGRHLEADRQGRRQQLAVVVDRARRTRATIRPAPSPTARPNTRVPMAQVSAAVARPAPPGRAGREESRTREPEDRGEEVRVAGRLPVHRLRPSLSGRQGTGRPVVGLGVEDGAREVGTVPQREDVTEPEGEGDAKTTAADGQARFSREGFTPPRRRRSLPPGLSLLLGALDPGGRGRGGALDLGRRLLARARADGRGSP